MPKILLSITLPEETIQTSEAHKRASMEEFLLIQGLPVPPDTDYWRFWTRKRTLHHLLTEKPNTVMEAWLKQLQERHVIESWDVEVLKSEE